MNKKNTKKKEFPYKYTKVCKICKRMYGHDAKSDNGKCPICVGSGNKLAKRIVTKQ